VGSDDELNLKQSAVPEERYEMFKVTAEEQTGKAWECKSMRRLISSAGE